MATELQSPAQAVSAPSSDTLHSGFEESVWRSPLVGVALALTAGIVLDRYLGIPLPFSLLAALAGLVAWWITRSAASGLPLVYRDDPGVEDN